MDEKASILSFSPKDGMCEARVRYSQRLASSPPSSWTVFSNGTVTKFESEKKKKSCNLYLPPSSDTFKTQHPPSLPISILLLGCLVLTRVRPGIGTSMRKGQSVPALPRGCHP